MELEVTSNEPYYHQYYFPDHGLYKDVCGEYYDLQDHQLYLISGWAVYYFGHELLED